MEEELPAELKSGQSTFLIEPLRQLPSVFDQPVALAMTSNGVMTSPGQADAGMNGGPKVGCFYSSFAGIKEVFNIERWGAHVAEW